MSKRISSNGGSHGAPKKRKYTRATYRKSKVTPKKKSTIYVRGFTEAQIAVKIDLDAPVKKLKKEIQKQYGITVENQALDFDGVSLDDDDQPLSAYSIKNAAKVDVTDKTRVPEPIVIFVRIRERTSPIRYTFHPQSRLRDLQKKLSELKSSPDDPDQMILFDGKLQTDSSVKLETFGNRSTLEAYDSKSTTVTVRNLGCEIRPEFNIDVDDFETGHSVKLKIFRATFIIPSAQQILVNGIQLEDNYLMREYDLTNQSILILREIRAAGKTICVNIQLPGDRERKFKIRCLDSVSVLTKLIQHFEMVQGYPMIEKLYLDKLQKDCQLLEWKSLSESNITNDCIIHALLSTKTEINVNHGNTSHSLEVDLVDFVSTVKDNLEAETGILADAQILAHNGWELEDGRTLLSYEIRKGSTLQLVTRSSGC